MPDRARSYGGTTAQAARLASCSLPRASPRITQGWASRTVNPTFSRSSAEWWPGPLLFPSCNALFWSMEHGAAEGRAGAPRTVLLPLGYRSMYFTLWKDQRCF